MASNNIKIVLRNAKNKPWFKVLMILLLIIVAILLIFITISVSKTIMKNKTKNKQYTVSDITQTDGISDTDLTGDKKSNIHLGVNYGKDEDGNNEVKETTGYTWNENSTISSNTGISSSDIAKIEKNITDKMTKLINEKYVSVSGVPGAKGEKGDPGKAGKDGVDGKDGRAGAAGATGATGARGATGATGATGAAGKDGKDGVDGVNGVDGKDGKDGKDGVDGKSTYIAYAEDSKGTGFSLSPTETTKYVGTCLSSSATQPTTPSSYVWQSYRTYVITSTTDPNTNKTTLRIN